MLSGLLISYLLVSKHYLTKKTIDWTGFILKRYFRILIPFVIASYFQSTIIDFLKYPTLLDNSYKLKGGSNDLQLTNIFLLFLQKYFYRFTKVESNTLQGFWFIQNEIFFSLLIPLVIMVYLRSPKAFYFCTIVGYIAYQIYAFTAKFTFPNYDPYDSFVTKRVHTQNFICLLWGILLGILYCEYVLASKVESLKESYGYRLLSSIKHSQKLSARVLIV